MGNRLYLETFVTNNLTGLKNALSNIASDDDDMNGSNGTEYLWDCAKGYKNNIEYLLDTVEGDTVDTVILDFFEKWFYHDGYYKNFSYRLLVIDKTTTCLAVTLETEC